MLVLTRRPGESVMVGDDVVITVLDVRGDVVRLGIKAPRSIQVHREEVYKELQRVVPVVIELALAGPAGGGASLLEA